MGFPNWRKLEHNRTLHYLDEKEKFDNSIKESIFRIFQIDLESWSKYEFIMVKHLNMSFMDFDNLEFYRIQYLMDNYKEHLDKEKERQEKQEKEQQTKFDMNRFANDQKSMSKSMTSGMKMPTMNIPKF